MDTSVAPTEAQPSTSAEPAFSLTPGAIAQVKQVMAEQQLAGHYLTVRVVPAGCSGLGYDLNLVKDTKAGDLIWDQDGVQICTDALSTKYLTGVVVDYVKSDMAAGFKFENPNAKSSCGCGSSFSA